jgi:signal transduction histidine kinase
MVIDDGDPNNWTHDDRMPHRSHIMRLIRRRRESDAALLLRSVCHELRPSIAMLSSLARAMENQPCPHRRTQMAGLATEYADHALSVLGEAGAMAAGQSARPGEAAALEQVLSGVAATVPDGRLSMAATPAAARWPVHRQHTQQILINLVGNAARHSAGAIRVSARLRSGRLRVAVADEGGPNRRLSRALRRPTPPDGDDGLGLWLVRHLARSHGGRLRARRGRPAGLVMEVVLPRYRP